MARTPEDRAAKVSKDRDRIRRNYKKNLDVKRRIRPGENAHIINQMVILKIAGYSNTQVARIINLSRGQVKEMLDRPEITELLESTRRNLASAAYDLLQSFSIEAVQAIADVMRTSGDDKIVVQAAAEILDRSGLPKASRSEQKIHRTTEELTTITDDGIVDRLREASPEIQEEAAQLVERIEELLAVAASEEEEVKSEGDNDESS